MARGHWAAAAFRAESPGTRGRTRKRKAGDTGDGRAGPQAGSPGTPWRRGSGASGRGHRGASGTPRGLGEGTGEPWAEPPHPRGCRALGCSAGGAAVRDGAAAARPVFSLRGGMRWGDLGPCPGAAPRRWHVRWAGAALSPASHPGKGAPCQHGCPSPLAPAAGRPGQAVPGAGVPGGAQPNPPKYAPGGHSSGDHGGRSASPRPPPAPHHRQTGLVLHMPCAAPWQPLTLPRWYGGVGSVRILPRRCPPFPRHSPLLGPCSPQPPARWRRRGGVSLLVSAPCSAPGATWPPPSCSAGAGARGGSRGPAGACEQGRGGARAGSGSSVCSIWLLPRASETGSPHPSVRPSIPGCVGRLLWGSPCPTSAQLGEGARASPRPRRLGSAAHPPALPSPVHGSCESGGCWWGWSCRVGCCGGGCSGAGWVVLAPGRLAGARAGVVALGLAGLSHQGRLCQAWRGCAVPGWLGHVVFGYGRTGAAALGGAVLHRGRLCWVWPHRAGSAGFGRAVWSWQGRCCRGPGWDCFCNCGLGALWKRHSFPLAGAGLAAQGVGAAVLSPAQREEKG